MADVSRTNSSLTTVLAMFNSMVGGAMLTFPILYRSAGIITSSVILIISGIISFITCRIYIFHMSSQDKQVEWTIRRILGKNWEKRFRLITGFYLILLCIIYIDLIVDQLYSIILFFFQRNSMADSIAPKDGFVFDKFSTQWLTIMLFLPLLALISIKNLNIMIKLSEYGAFSALLYFGFVVYKFIASIAANDINMDNINWISWDIGNLAGTCALAFTIHTMVVTFLQPNINQKNNVRDVGLSYFMGFLLYEFIGVIGAFAVSGIECKETLVNCYLQDWTVLIVEASYLFGRITVFPCTLQVSRTRLIQLFYDKVEDRHFKYFNIGFMILASIFSILSPFLPLSLLMNIVGAVICYFFIYLIPTKIHYACLYHPKKEDKEQSLIESITSLDEDKASSTGLHTCAHDINYANQKPKFIRFFLYVIINLIGMAIGIYGLYISAVQIFG